MRKFLAFPLVLIFFWFFPVSATSTLDFIGPGRYGVSLIVGSDLDLCQVYIFFENSKNIVTVSSEDCKKWEFDFKAQKAIIVYETDENPFSFKVIILGKNSTIRIKGIQEELHGNWDI